MNELSVTSIISDDKYQHAVVEDDSLTLSNIGTVHGTEVYNRLVEQANENDKFYEFLPFYNYAGILTYDDNTGFELNLFKFASLDEVFDLYAKFDSLEWTPQEKSNFTKIVDDILKSTIQPAKLSVVQVGY